MILRPFYMKFEVLIFLSVSRWFMLREKPPFQLETKMANGPMVWHFRSVKVFLLEDLTCDDTWCLYEAYGKKKCEEELLNNLWTMVNYCILHTVCIQLLSKVLLSTQIGAAVECVLHGWRKCQRKGHNLFARCGFTQLQRGRWHKSLFQFDNDLHRMITINEYSPNRVKQTIISTAKKETKPWKFGSLLFKPALSSPSQYNR